MLRETRHRQETRSHAQSAQLRERVYELLIQGYENGEIERELKISKWTLHNQLHALRQLHGIATTRRLVLYLAKAPGHWPKKRVPLRTQPCEA